MTTVARQIEPGQLFVTGPGSTLFAMIDPKSSSSASSRAAGLITVRDIVTDRIMELPDSRQCRMAGPADLTRAATRMRERAIFHPKHTEPVGV